MANAQLPGYAKKSVAIEDLSMPAIRYSLFFVLSILSPTLIASTPSSYPGDPERFNMNQCVQQNIKNCLRAVCIPGTPTNCADQCRSNARQKCQAMSTQHL